MRKSLVVVLSGLTIVFVSPMHARGGHGGHAGGAIFVSPHHGMRSPFRRPHSFVRQPFLPWGAGVGWTNPEEVVVIPQLAAPSTDAPPAPDPKFVFPPTPSSPSPPGSQTVTVQHGSQIEVQSFPAAR